MITDGVKIDVCVIIEIAVRIQAENKCFFPPTRSLQTTFRAKGFMEL